MSENIKDKIARAKQMMDKSQLEMSAATGTFRWIRENSKIGAHAKSIIDDSENVAVNAIAKIRDACALLDEIQRELWANEK